jgi:predicted phosphodiesterase
MGPSEVNETIMRYALLSDVHGRYGRLRAVLADADRRGADRCVSLGDVGGADCLSLLRAAEAGVVFGNYEVSGWKKLPERDREWVRGWPALLAGDGFLAVHAAPCWPDGLATVEDFGTYLEEQGCSWRALFPYLLEESECLWNSLAQLQSAGKAVLFHGHTHRQTVWRYSASGYLRALPASAIRLDPGNSYVVGVGSVGLPEDGGWAAYTIYDTTTGRIEPVRLHRPDSP